MAFRPNLKFKFTLTLCSLLAVAVISLGWIFLLQVEESALERLREKGAILAKGLADGSELGVLTHNVAHLGVVLGSLREQEDVVYAGVADERGRILAEHRTREASLVPGWAAAPRAAAGRRERRGEEPDAPDPLPRVGFAEGPQHGGAVAYYFWLPILAEHAAIGEEVGILLGGEGERRRIGTACVGVSAASVMREIHGLRRGLVLATMAVLVAGVALGIWLVRVIVEPIKQLVHATDRIASGDLDIVLPRRGRDEIGALADSFNQMTLNLRESRQALERSNSDLENKVRERTSALKEAQDHLVQAEKMTVVGQLVSGVAHELNNPLAGVLGYSQLLLRKGPDDAMKRGLQKIEAEAERCKRIVQNLLIFARKHKPHKTLLDLNAVVESTLEMRDYHLKTDNVTVIRDLDPTLPRTMADANQMQQVFMNMINNAQHAMMDVKRPRSLTVATSHADGLIRLRIEDNGSGIEKGNLGKIFDPFFTTKEVGRGTGLGLSICYGIVQEHRGTIRVESEPGRGTRFLIELPVQGDAADEQSADAALLEAIGAGAPRRGRILLVDDEASILEVIGDVLRMDGHQVAQETNGLAALGRLQKESFDVVVSDLKMPGMSGQDLFARLAETRPDILRRLVFTTGDLASPETLAFLERTGNPYLQKPFDLNAVRRLVALILRRAA